MSKYQRYNSNIQNHPTQIAAIAGAILSSRDECNLLVFGVGNDSGVWMDINRKGHTLFLEDDLKWAEVARDRYQDINIQIVDYSAWTVERALADPDAVISTAGLPHPLGNISWDVILIDGPRGYRSTHPGRSLPITWASKIRTRKTHIFVDDYYRPLESQFADRLLLADSVNSTTIRRPGTKEKMLWCIGDPIT